MRSRPDRAALALGLAATLGAAGCGTWSNDDVAFVHALPQPDHLRVALPESTSAAGPTALAVTCPAPGASEVWGWARPAGLAFNAMVEFMLGFVDAVQRLPPTTRHEDARTWGPWDDDKHPGKEVRVRMTRSAPDGLPSYAYVFEARPKGQGDYQPLVDGSFVGATARTGHGQLALHFAALRALDMSDHPDTDPQGDVVAQYDRTGEPRTLGLHAPTQGAVSSFDYGYAGYTSGSGLFAYVVSNTAGDSYHVTARFDATGAGRAEVSLVLAGAQNPLAFSECWDVNACITRVDDPYAGLWWAPNGISKLCENGVCPQGACPNLGF